MSDAALLRCRLCNSSPAVRVTVHEHHGMVILMQHMRYRGPLCRDCGMKVLRRCTSRTLVMGWWGVISLFVGTPVTLLLDLVAWLRIRRLAVPVTAPAGSQGVAPAVPVAAAAAPAVPGPPPLVPADQPVAAPETAGP
jgi:hypothetical protein